mmetsp:Transcript_21673/g.38482  ORF Transcript_21673/g.38482 Transcript_21673/m.38482 type:complete len:819 (+) Transcript_21673:29-2485(+)
MSMFLTRYPKPRASRWARELRQRCHLSTAKPSDREHILRGLKKQTPEVSPRWLYDSYGSELFERITETEEYYLTRKEQELLDLKAHDIAPFLDEIDQDSTQTSSVRRVLVELGAGSGRKTTTVLEAMKRISGKDTPVTYMPIDVSGSALMENAEKYNLSKSGIVLKPQVGMYQDKLKDISTIPGRKTILFLGSSLGNYADGEAIELMSLVRSHMGPRDRFLVGVDTPHGSHKHESIIEAAYNDKQGITAEFTLNSLQHINRQARLDFDLKKFRHVAEYDKDKKAIVTHVESLEDQVVTAQGEGPLLTLKKADRIFMETSRKFSLDMMKNLGKSAGLLLSRHWETDDGCHLLVELIRDYYTETKHISKWIFDDLVEKGMGGDGLLNKPIELRHPFIFYKGHIPAFSMAKSLPLHEQDRIPGFSGSKAESLRAVELADIFERGMDPEIGGNNAGSCHRHSTVPPVWPSKAEVQEYDDGVREAVRRRIEGVTGYDRMALLGYEHEVMHQETLMYMAANNEVLEQKKPTHVNLEELFPTDLNSPLTAMYDPALAGIAEIPGGENVVLGATPQEEAELGFVWDNEIPHLTIDQVPSFKASKLPVTNGDFLAFVQDGGYSRPELWGGYRDMVNGDDDTISHPVAWLHSQNEDYRVRTLLDGPQDMKIASKWPVICSYAEAEAYCNWLGNGARVMTEAEYSLIFHHEHYKQQDTYARAALSGNNNWKYSGVTPVGSMADATPVFGMSDLVGNGWEWTSTPFEPFPGFVPMEEYSEYSTDFFGHHHNVIKGGSPFTDRQLCRLSLRNWFQGRYRYVWAKFRVAYDN